MMNFHRVLTRFRNGDEGLGLIEVVVALGVLFVAVTALVASSLVSFQDTGLARQRQGANGIANEVIERVRGLPIPTVLEQGLRTEDLNPATDEHIASDFTFRGEPLVHRSGLPDADPLVPYSRQTVRPGCDLLNPQQGPGCSTIYTQSVYVTRVDAPSANTYRVTVIVTWPAPSRAGRSNFVESQTIIYRPVGCVDPAMNPFAAPCSPYFRAAGEAAQGRIGIHLPGVEEPSVTLFTPRTLSDLHIEQITRIQSQTVGSGGVSGTQTVGGESVSTQADDDPATTTPTYQSVTTSAGAGTQTAPVVPGVALAVSAHTSSENLMATSAIAAGGTAPSGSQNCPLTGSPPSPSLPAQTNLLPCGHSRYSQPSGRSLEASLQGSLLGINLQTQIASMNSTSSSTGGAYLYTRREPVAGQDGRATVNAARSLPEIQLLGLPAALTSITVPLLGTIPLPGWEGYLIRIQGYSDNLSAQAGSSTSPPGAGSTGTLRVLTGGSGTTLLPFSYTNIPLNAPSTAVNINFNRAPVSIGGISVGAQVTGTINSRPAASVTSVPAGSTPGVPRTQAQASIPSPLVAELTYRLTVGTQVVELDIHADLGSLTAGTTYREATVGP